MFLESIKLVKTLAHFPNLRYIRAPREAFFSADQNLNICTLPVSIKHVAIYGDRCAITCYIKHLLRNRASYLNLRHLCLNIDQHVITHANRPRIKMLEMESSRDTGEVKCCGGCDVDNAIRAEMESKEIRLTQA